MKLKIIHTDPFGSKTDLSTNSLKKIPDHLDWLKTFLSEGRENFETEIFIYTPEYPTNINIYYQP